MPRRGFGEDPVQRAQVTSSSVRAIGAGKSTRPSRPADAPTLAVGRTAPSSWPSLTVTPESEPYSEFRTDDAALAAYEADATALGRPSVTGGGAARMNRASTDTADVSQVVRAIRPYVRVDSHGAANHEPGFAAACVGASADAMVHDAATASGWTVIDVLGPRQDTSS